MFLNMNLMQQKSVNIVERKRNEENKDHMAHKRTTNKRG